MKLVIVFLIRVYQTISRLLLPRACRFHPSCSCYAIDCVHKYGVARGLKKSFFRILKCHPFMPGGYDPA